MTLATRPKIQHRWLVPPAAQHLFDHLPAQHIVQGFLGPNLSLSVRVTDGTHADVTCTTGHGLMRFTTDPEPISLAAAQMMLAKTLGRIIRKFRRHTEGWKIDTLELPFYRVMLAEREKADVAEPVTLPDWLDGATEVTNRISMRALANSVARLDTDRTVAYEQVISPVLTAAVTGTDASGKTGLKEMILGDKRLMTLIHPLFEVASMVIEKAFVDVPPEPSENRVWQGGVYGIQCALEELAQLQARLAGKRLIMTDRGTIDGCAYFAGGKAELCSTVGTTEAEEFARYDRVIMLAPPPREVWDTLKKDPTKWNPARRDRTYEQALVLSDRIHESWHAHPGFRYIDGATWEEKAAKARTALLSGIIDD